MNDEKMTLDEFHLKMGKKTNGGVWGVLDNDKPAGHELEEALEMAYTSRYHWRQVGTLTNDVRAVYMICRVYAHMGKGDTAIAYGKLMLELAKKAATEDKDNWADFDMPFVYEALAKAYAADGNKDECARYKKMAQDLTDELKDKQDQEICQGEINKISC